jgi:hypothetical protein
MCNFGETISNAVMLKRQKEKSSGTHHYSTIVQGHFAFDQTVIDDFRVKLGSLIDNLEKIYTQHREGTAVKFGKKRSVAKENPKATKMPKATDVFEFDPDCDTDSVKHIMAEVEYHIMQQNKDNQLHQLLQVDNTTPSDVLQPDVIEEEDRKPTLSKQRKIL